MRSVTVTNMRPYLCFLTALLAVAVSSVAARPNVDDGGQSGIVNDNSEVSYAIGTIHHTHRCQGSLFLEWDILEKTLTAGTRQRCRKIGRLSRSSMYGQTGITALATGNCCWTVFSRSKCRGESHFIGSGNVAQLDHMAVKTARVTLC